MDQGRESMINASDVDRIAQGWITEYSQDPYVVRVERDRRYYFELDDLIYQDPQSALLVFEVAARQNLSDWCQEGLAGGPIREFLYLHPDVYASELAQIASRTPAFSKLYALALEGM